MHELSVTKQLIKMICSECKERGMKNPKAVHTELGNLTSYRKDSILFYYDILKKENKSLMNSELEINEIKGVLLCNSCSKKSDISEPYLIFCPLCDSHDVKVVKGKEFKILEIEE